MPKENLGCFIIRVQMVSKYKQMQWLYLSRPVQLLLHEHVLEVEGDGVDAVALQQHDNTAWQP